MSTRFPGPKLRVSGTPIRVCPDAVAQMVLRIGVFRRVCLRLAAVQVARRRLEREQLLQSERPSELEWQ